MKRLLLTLVILIFLVAYMLTNGSYGGVLVGILLLPACVVVQLIVMKLFFPRKPNAEEIE
ncbi:MAG: hypothetical protein SH868_10190 [Bythopirellula sp.]|nr:hypothetical protein [Bythopirellula sp.]